ncbi:MAG: efflux RND transporter permease subunit, partial [Marinobacter sp.]
QALGFSVNLLTLFGLILAIGVVDNAIIIMENAERLMKEEGMSAYHAAVETVKQVAGAVVPSTLVLVAVFAPVAFLGGLSGELYRQFAITIAVSVVISGVVALTLTPTMCAMLLGGQPKKQMAFFRWFDRGFEVVTNGFVRVVDFLLRHVVVGVFLFVAMLAGTVLLLNSMASGLVPKEDQGFVLVAPSLPPASSLSRTADMRDELASGMMEVPEIANVVAFAGYDIISSALRTNAGWLS